VSPQELAGLRKTELRKDLIAWEVKRRTSVTNRWLSQRLHMGHYTSASKPVRIIERSADRSVRTVERQL